MSKKKILIPAGASVWPALVTPKQFKGEGPFTYECVVRLDLKDPKIAKLKSDLDTMFQDNKAEAIAEGRSYRNEKPLTPAQLKKDAPLPWKLEENDEGEETGFLVVKAKLKAERKLRGDMVKQRPSLFDENGQPWDMDVPVWGGSVVAMSVEPKYWFMGSIGGCGCTLDLRAAQVMSLVNGENESGSAEDFGFQVNEVAEAEEAEVVAEEDAFESDGFQNVQDL